MKNITTIITSLILFASVPVAFAWTAAPKNPPKDNAPAPITVADVDQNKQGKLGLGGLAVFGKFQLIDGTQGVGKVLVSDANGKASWAPMAGVGSGGTTVSSSGQPIVCGGWDVKYGTSGAINEWGCATGASCPAGYDTIKSSKVTINLAEQTNLCVLSRAGGGGSSVSLAQAIRAAGYNLPKPNSLPEWPNAIVCEGVGGQAGQPMILPLAHRPGESTVAYWVQDGIGIFFDTKTGAVSISQRILSTCGGSKADIFTMCSENRCIY